MNLYKSGICVCSLPVKAPQLANINIGLMNLKFLNCHYVTCEYLYIVPNIYETSVGTYITYIDGTFLYHKNIEHNLFYSFLRNKAKVFNILFAYIKYLFLNINRYLINKIFFLHIYIIGIHCFNIFESINKDNKFF